MSPGDYRVLLDVIVRALLVTLLPILRLLLRSGIQNPATRRQRLNRFVPIVAFHVRASRVLVGDLSARFIAAQALEQVGQTDPYIPALAGYSEQSVRTSLESLVDDVVAEPEKREKLIEKGASTFVRHAEQAGRQMVVDAVEPPVGEADNTIAEEMEGTSPDPADPAEPADEPVEDAPLATVTELPRLPPQSANKSRDPRRPFAYARILHGETNCAFCVMLASRGPIYESKTSGLGSNGNIFDKYHDNCDCGCIPVYTSKSWPGKEQAAELYKLWLSSTDGYSQGSAINALRRELSRKKRAGEALYPGYVEVPRTPGERAGLTAVA